jgi:putative endonuclease
MLNNRASKRIVYIVTDRNRNTLHVGMSSDLEKTLAFYKNMPNLFFDQGQQLTRLVYFEEFKSEAQAVNRFKMISHFTRTQKEKLVRTCNPNWHDLTNGIAANSKLVCNKVFSSVSLFQ